MYENSIWNNFCLAFRFFLSICGSALAGTCDYIFELFKFKSGKQIKLILFRIMANRSRIELLRSTKRFKRNQFLRFRTTAYKCINIQRRHNRHI